MNSRPFSIPLAAASPTLLFTDSMVSLTAELESFCAYGLVEKRTRLVAAKGARGALMATVLRRDMSFAGFWKWKSCCCCCCLESWGIVSWVVVCGGKMMSGGRDLRTFGRRHFGLTGCCLVRVGIGNFLAGDL